MPWSIERPVHTDSCQSGCSYDFSLAVDDPVNNRCGLEMPLLNAAASQPAMSTHASPARLRRLLPSSSSEMNWLSTDHRYMWLAPHGPVL